jgi:hypothetical protein
MQYRHHRGNAIGSIWKSIAPKTLKWSSHFYYLRAVGTEIVSLLANGLSFLQLGEVTTLVSTGRLLCFQAPWALRENGDTLNCRSSHFLEALATSVMRLEHFSRHTASIKSATGRFRFLLCFIKQLAKDTGSWGTQVVNFTPCPPGPHRIADGIGDSRWLVRKPVRILCRW